MKKKRRLLKSNACKLIVSIIVVLCVSPIIQRKHAWITKNTLKDVLSLLLIYREWHLSQDCKNRRRSFFFCSQFTDNKVTDTVWWWKHNSVRPSTFTIHLFLSLFSSLFPSNCEVARQRLCRIKLIHSWSVSDFCYANGRNGGDEETAQLSFHDRKWDRIWPQVLAILLSLLHWLSRVK